MKYRRTAVPWLVLICPVLVVSISSVYVAPHRIQATAWPTVLNIGNEVWSGLWIPIGWGLIAGLAGELEASAGRWRWLRSIELAPGLLYIAKAFVLAFFTFVGCVWLWALLLIAGGVLRIPYPMPIGIFVACMAVNWLSALPWLWTALWLAEGSHWGVLLGIGAIGTIVASIIGGATALGNNIWPFIPWTWPMRFVYLIYDMLTPELQSAAPQIIFWSVLIAAVILSIIMLLLGTWWFHRRDVV
ncbi:ABC transporter permease [Alicyclobacillus tolerans]|uniref:ABC transporter permease n=1 Tax=Alicyclobacillus tolerans TaxID=90970 RepID=UPI003B7DCB3C